MTVETGLTGTGQSDNGSLFYNRRPPCPPYRTQGLPRPEGSGEERVPLGPGSNGVRGTGRRHRRPRGARGAPSGPPLRPPTHRPPWSVPSTSFPPPHPRPEWRTSIASSSLRRQCTNPSPTGSATFCHISRRSISSRAILCAPVEPLGWSVGTVVVESGTRPVPAEHVASLNSGSSGEGWRSTNDGSRSRPSSCVSAGGVERRGVVRLRMDEPPLHHPTSDLDVSFHLSVTGPSGSRPSLPVLTEETPD